MFLGSLPDTAESQEARISALPNAGLSTLPTLPKVPFDRSVGVPSNVTTLFSRSLALSPAEREVGEEMEIALELAEQLRGVHHTEAPLPTLHLVQKIVAEGDPRYQSSERARPIGLGEAAFGELWKRCDAYLSRHRAQIKDRLVVTPQSLSILLFHEDRNFVPDVLQGDLRELLGPKIAEIKARSVEMSFIRPFGVEVTQEETHFLQDVYRYGTTSPKSDLAKELRQVVNDTRSPALVWIMAHGDTHGISLFDSAAGTERSPKNDSSEGRITPQQLASMLMSPVGEATEQGAVQLGHLTLVLDACYQHQFAAELHAALVEEAGKEGREIAEFPVIVAASQRDTPANFLMARVSIRSHDQRDETEAFDRSQPVEVGDAFSSSLSRAMGENHYDSGSLRLRDLFVFTDTIRELYAFQLEDPSRRRLTGGSIFQPDKVWASEVPPLTTQSPVIFSPFPVSRKAVLSSISSGLSERELFDYLLRQSRLVDDTTFALEIY